MTRMRRLGLRKPPAVEVTTWDWRKRDYHLIPRPGGLTAIVSYWTDGGWGSPQFAGQNPTVGDYVILRTKAEHGTRYRITSIEAPSPTNSPTPGRNQIMTEPDGQECRQVDVEEGQGR
ncbi:hypothetical protein ACFWMR_02005 [Amycolatopsis thailandensis]|uniref:hypothetical protein n=1 Tax=Amycolatopsis thailandensis TaxID=589330 RepID=UPI00366A37ED